GGRGRVRGEPGDQVHGPAAPAGASGPSRAERDRLPTVVSECARDHLVRGRSRVSGARPEHEFVRRGRGVRAEPPVPGRALPERCARRGADGDGYCRSLAADRARGALALVKVGIVGLPNAGKTSLFSALTGVAAEAANYPFTTIQPNVAVVPVADRRLDAVS